MTEPNSTPSLRQTFEAALVANPDDLAAHMAYADWLTEQGDPRGKLIQVQLALEQASGPEHERLAQLEAALLAEHQKAWLGDLAEPFLERDDISFVFRRGWLDEIVVGTMRQDLAGQLAQAPQLRLLRRLAVLNPNLPPLDRGEAYQQQVLTGVAWFAEEEETALVPLLDCPYLGNVRIFQLGDAEHERCDVGDGPILGLLDKMPKLEILHLFLWRLEDIEPIFARPFPHLRELHIGGEFPYPPEVLAGNASLRSLTDLLLQPAAPGGHSKLNPYSCAELVASPHLTALRRLRLRFVMFGDALCEAIAGSGILARLDTLDLQYSDITDNGLRWLIESGDLPRLKLLNLVGNHLTDEGIASLRATGAHLVWEPQTSPNEADAEPAEGADEEMGPGQVRCEFCHEPIDAADYPEHREQHLQLREDGQQTDYATLPPEERATGTLEDVPRVYRHVVCGTATEMPEEIIRSYLENPYLYLADQTFCTGCGDHVPFAECVWIETDQDLQSYMDGLREEKLEPEPEGGGLRVDELIQECRELFGPPPRSLSAEDAAACSLRLTPDVEQMYEEASDALLSILRDQSALHERGRVVWGQLVQANNMLFDSDNPHTLPANVIYSPEADFDGALALLQEIAQGLFALKNTVPLDEELRALVEAITNERERILRRELPSGMCVGHSVCFATCFVQPSHLPDNRLALPIFPLLVCPEETEAVMILPSRYWPDLLVALWQSQGEEG